MTDVLFIQILLSSLPLLMGAFLCYLPMRKHLKLPAKKLFFLTAGGLIAYIPLSSLFMAAYPSLNHNLLFVAALAVLFIPYRLSLNLNIWKVAGTYMMVISVFCFAALYTHCFTALRYPHGQASDHNWFSCFVNLALCMIMTIILTFPLKHHFSWMTAHVDSDKMWKTVTLWAGVFTAASFAMIPHYYDTLWVGRVFIGYLIIITVMMINMFTLYFFMYQSSRAGYEMAELSTKNQLLGFQSSQYVSLLNHMEETRRLRHDFRQHLHVITELTNAKDYDALNNYLSKYMSELEEDYHLFCKNPAVNAILKYYYSIARNAGVRTEYFVDLPDVLPIPEPDFCMMVGNLFENALEALKTVTGKERTLKLYTHMPSSSMLSILVENDYHGTITERNGKILSAKKDGSGIGLESVQKTAERYHGITKINYDNRIFKVQILLNVDAHK